MGKAVNNQDYRYERKFSISALNKHEIEAIIKLHPGMFSEIYHERFVNNVYFDTFKMKSYFESANGLRDRVKVRIRWYGNVFGVIEKPVLELKIKTGLLGRKDRFPLIPFAIDDKFRPETIADVIKKSSMSDMLKEDMASLEVSLFNRYRRKYFQSADRKYRITIDSELEFYQIRACNNTFLHKLVDPGTTIVELKYGQERDNEAKWITGYFPYRMTKSSKYVNGIERLCLW